MKLIAALIVVLIPALASAHGGVRGYVRKDGTYVAPYQRTAPNGTINDNYSTKGNVNPYTGKAGTVTKKHDSIYVEQPKYYSPPEPPKQQPTQPKLANPGEPDYRGTLGPEQLAAFEMQLRKEESARAVSSSGKK